MHMLYAMNGGHADPARLCAVLKEGLGGATAWADDDAMRAIDEVVAKLADRAIHFDLHLQGSKQDIELLMTHPETGEKCGFSSATLEGWKDYLWVEGLYSPGALVDFIEEPGVRVWGKERLDVPLLPYITSHHQEMFLDSYDKAEVVIPTQVCLRRIPWAELDKDGGAQTAGENGAVEEDGVEEIHKEEEEEEDGEQPE